MENVLFIWHHSSDSRGATARQVTFKVPVELESYLEVLPGQSVVQGKDSLSVQLKFNPGQPLLQTGPAREKFADSNGKWKIHVIVEVGGQVSQGFKFLQ